MSREKTTENLIASYDAITALMADLAEDDWAIQSLCPDWDVRGVIVHLASVEDALRGWKPTDEDATPPFDRAATFTQAALDWSTPDLVDRANAIFAARKEDLSKMSDQDFAQEQQTPVGPGTYHRFMDIRVFDFWVHERDITTPLGRSTDDTTPAAERALEEVAMSASYIVGKKVGLPDGQSVTFDITGPIKRQIHVAVDGRASIVDSLSDASVTVSADSLTFVQLACGRIDPQGPIDDGRISWSGDDELGRLVAGNLRFTM